MEIFWLCPQCDSTNNYLETKVCSVCGENIDPKAEEKCIYEMAELLYEKAGTSHELFKVCELYRKILDYKDARQKHNECQFKAEKTLLNEKIYQTAKEYLDQAEAYNLAEKWTEAQNAFALAQQQFEKIAGFMDADGKTQVCRREKELCRNKEIYFAAKKLLISAASIADYKKAAELFAQITQFTDAKENYDLCMKSVERLTARQQYEELLQQSRLAAETVDLDQKIIALLKIVDLENAVLSEDAKKVVLQSKPILEECLKKKQAIQTREDLNAAAKQYEVASDLQDATGRAAEFEKILNRYQKYAQAAEFSSLFTQCREKLNDAKKHIAYAEALSAMNSAVSAADYKKAAEAFGALSGFRDANQNKEVCAQKADLLTKQGAYQLALETYEKGRRIHLFNWKKYV